jgi:hypothetical protein
MHAPWKYSEILSIESLLPSSKPFSLCQGSTMVNCSVPTDTNLTVCRRQYSRKCCQTLYKICKLYYEIFQTLSKYLFFNYNTEYGITLYHSKPLQRMNSPKRSRPIGRSKTVFKLALWTTVLYAPSRLMVQEYSSELLRFDTPKGAPYKPRQPKLCSWSTNSVTKFLTPY